ncbi:polysaccharide deacetylase family protein, PEP-CTERM locus subfamily (plasmid) [Methanosarcina sp. Kolksee]|uniref:polysaccharide deacetylase family protein n=1 Tax=Methanosarcina sp. Kolksee TaxID=1434099 RepID=UPI000615716E|nr:polysaccharide deacetylase family protein [Methanosarcina sp. Kolksee]AKB45786.1 polysaccharide deacetylase family protein, PEP-CTERM locus subfamily [Methanosarcina sp. Kolksee]
MKNALVIDLEHWYSNEFLIDYLPSEKVDQDLEAVKPILDLLDKYNLRVTFCVLGTFAERHPELVKYIHEKGHEIQSHAYSHKTLHELGKDAFEDEIIKSVNLLESITGEKPIGFRAPSFSIDNSTKWAFEVLGKYGFKYDSSIFPIKTMLYGEPKAPVNIYRPSKDNVTKNDPNGNIIEFPMTVLNFGINFPLAGGFYLRVLPLWFLIFGIKYINKKRPAIVYIHPWETYPKTPRLKLPLFSRFVAYYGINSSLLKLEGLLKEFHFTNIKEILDNSCSQAYLKP